MAIADAQSARTAPIGNDSQAALGPLRDHGDFHFAVAVLHVLEHRRKLAQRNFRVDEVAGADIAARNSLERLANEARRVVERRLDGDLRIVQRRRVKLHLRAARAAAKEIHRAAAAHHLQSPLPRDAASPQLRSPNRRRGRPR